VLEALCLKRFFFKFYPHHTQYKRFLHERGLNLPPMKKTATQLFSFINLSSLGTNLLHGVYFLQLPKFRKLEQSNPEKKADF
jgi:hypothetical protein